LVAAFSGGYLCRSTPPHRQAGACQYHSDPTDRQSEHQSALVPHTVEVCPIKHPIDTRFLTVYEVTLEGRATSLIAPPRGMAEVYRISIDHGRMILLTSCPLTQ
jgi:hypothetical protein